MLERNFSFRANLWRIGNQNNREWWWSPEDL